MRDLTTMTRLCQSPTISASLLQLRICIARDRGTTLSFAASVRYLSNIILMQSKSDIPGGAPWP
ncbi:hypothetical protein SAMN05192541_103358 [Bradyrhizobium arachidis]|nr:hypothetical protein SAMN05192541_103358 [Bradyrhizobium arachidis]